MPLYIRPRLIARGCWNAEIADAGDDDPGGSRCNLRDPAATPDYAAIQTLVVIYAENRSFDNLYGTFPGANGLAEASPQSITQLDRDGRPMSGLPAIWGGIGRKVLQGAPLAPIDLTEGQTAVFLNELQSSV